MITSEISDRFYELLRTWEAETAYSSSPSELAAHPARDEIVQLGWPVVPMLIWELGDTRSLRWLDPLTEIVGINHAAGSRTAAEAHQAWVRWARNPEGAPEELRQDLYSWSCTCGSQQVFYGGCICVVSRGERSRRQGLRLRLVKLHKMLFPG